MEKVKMEDLAKIEIIAKKYNMTVPELARAVAAQTKVRKECQYRVSDEEFKIISAKAEKAGLTLMAHTVEAVKAFLNSGEADPAVVKFQIGSTRYGHNRTRRIAVRFGDEAVEWKLLNMSEEYAIDLGSLMRYCALTY